jgi:septal ring factor EnvC (AmiA/AmiB activator)
MNKKKLLKKQKKAEQKWKEINLKRDSLWQELERGQGELGRLESNVIRVKARIKDIYKEIDEINEKMNVGTVADCAPRF